MLPASQQAENISRGIREVRRQNDIRQSPRTKQRLIKVDFSLFRVSIHEYILNRLCFS